MPAVRNVKPHRHSDSNSSALPDGVKYRDATLCEHPTKLEPIERDIVFKSSSSTSGLPPLHATSPKVPRGQTASTTKKSHGRRRGEGYIARPRNCFIVFRSWFVKEHKDSSNQQNKLSEQAAKMWRTMASEEKQRFMEIATQEQKAHKLAYPDYQYAPGPRRSPSSSGSKSVKSTSKKANSASGRLRKKDGNDSDDWTESSASPPSYPAEDLVRAPRAAAVIAAQRLERIKTPSPPIQESGDVFSPDIELSSASSDHQMSASVSLASSPLLVPTEINLTDQFDGPQEVPPFVIDNIPVSLRPGSSIDAMYNEQLKAYPLDTLGHDPMSYDYERANPPPGSLSDADCSSDGNEDPLDEWLYFSDE